MVLHFNYKNFVETFLLGGCLIKVKLKLTNYYAAFF